MGARGGRGRGEGGEEWEGREGRSERGRQKLGGGRGSRLTEIELYEVREGDKAAEAVGRRVGSFQFRIEALELAVTLPSTSSSLVRLAMAQVNLAYIAAAANRANVSSSRPSTDNLIAFGTGRAIALWHSTVSSSSNPQPQQLLEQH